MNSFAALSFALLLGPAAREMQGRSSAPDRLLKILSTVDPDWKCHKVV
jgi:hypothetical protein